MSNNNMSIQELTKRELDVLSLMTQSLSNQDISSKLNVSIETVRTHAKRIYSKLDVSGRQEASFRAIELGIIKSKTLDTKRITTPIPITPDPFIGRETELNDLEAIFAQNKCLITILGAGGMGKTRLAIQYAHDHVAEYPDGVYFIPLETVTSVDNIVLQIIDCLPLRLSRQGSPQQQLLKFLHHKHMLLIIDNWEHLLDGALIITEMLRAAPKSHIMTTSRERLRLRHEVVYRLEGMTIPQWDTIEDALEYDAVQLLSQTAKHVNPEWQVRHDNLQSIHDLCKLTQGMPLGIILSAGWLDVYPLERIVEEIQKNVDFLETQLRDIPERHRSIRAVFEWTWGLLSQDERDVFMKLSVFRNGCTLSAAEEVAGASPYILQSLINKALCHRDVNKRYVLHELLRQYGEDELRQTPDMEQQTRDAHANYYIHVAEDIITNRFPAREGELEFENLYMAWYWMIDTQNIEMLWQSINPYAMMTYQFGAFSEMKIIYDYAITNLDNLETTYPHLLASIYCVHASTHAYLLVWDIVQHDLERAKTLFGDVDLETVRLEVAYAQYHLGLATRNINQQEALERIHQLEHVLESRDLSQSSTGLSMLSYAYSQQGIIHDYAARNVEAKQYALKALQLARRIQQKTIIALSTEALGEIEFSEGNYELAREYIQESEEMYRQLISTFDFGKMLCLAGSIAIAQGEYDKARQYLHEALNILADYGLLNMVIQLICTVADWMQSEGYVSEAIELVIFCRGQTNATRYANYVEQLLDTMSEKLPAKAFRQATERGQALNYEAVIRELTVWLED